MEDLFEYPPTHTAGTSRARPVPQARIFSHKVTVPSRSGGKDVEYARLSDADHDYARAVIETLDEHRHILGRILDEASGLYGQRSRSRQTKGDLLHGLMEKLRLPHPRVRGRRGEDFTLKQLRALNGIIDDVNAHIEGDGIAHVVVP